jgi:hypothetical protein
VKRTWLLTSIALTTLWTPSNASDLHVGTGSSIQAAINSANDGDRILIEAGTYFEVLDLQGKRLQIVGTSGAQATILDGAGLDDAVVKAEGCPEGTLLRGLTLTHGAGRPSPSSYGFDYYGGAVWAAGGSKLSIQDCRLIDNGWGTGTFAGGVYSGGEGTDVSIVRTVIARNRAWASGGATLCDYYGEMTLDHCTVWGNSSNNFFGHQGGVSVANWGKVWITNSILWANEGSQVGAFGSPYNVGTEIDVAFTDIQGGYSGLGNFSLDPAVSDPSIDDYALLPASPCIDAGNPATVGDCDGSTTDLGADLPVCQDCDGNGTDDSFDLTIDGEDADGNGILDSCQPIVIAISPAAAPWYEETALTIDGAGFEVDSVIEVQIGTSPVLIATVVDSTQLTVDIPAGHIGDAGPVQVQIESATSTLTLEDGFDVLPSLQADLSGDSATGGIVDFQVTSSLNGFAYFFMAASESPTPLALPGIHGALALDLLTTVKLGAGELATTPSLSVPYAPGYPAGSTIPVQGLAVEFVGSTDTFVSFTNHQTVVIP